MKKLHSNARQQLHIAETVCDRCGAIISAQNAEFNEFLSIDRQCGSGSLFGEGRNLRLDLCQVCVKEVLGDWIRVQEPIPSGQVERLMEFITLVQYSFANNQAAIDVWLDKCNPDLGGESPNTFFERTGQTEPITNLLRKLR